MDTLNSPLKRLQINAANWEDIARDPPTWRRTMKTGAAIYEANRITATKAKREARKSQLRPPRNANAQPPPTCSHYKRTFQALTGLRTKCGTRTTPASPFLPSSASSCTPSTNSDRLPEPPRPSSSSTSIASASATAVPVPTTAAHNPNTPANINLPTINASDVDSIHTCHHYDRTFTSTHLYHTSSSPTTSIQLPPPTQVGNVYLDSVHILLLCCLCDSSPRARPKRLLPRHFHTCERYAAQSPLCEILVLVFGGSGRACGARRKGH